MGLLPYIARRLARAVVALLAITFVTFVIFYVIPQDPARSVITVQNPSEEQLRQAREYLGTDDPLVVQWVRFVWRLGHGSFGLTFGRPGQREDVTSVLLDAAPVTLSLLAGAALIWTSFALVVGTLAARRPRSSLDRGVLVLTLVAISVHPLSIGLTLKYLLGFKWQVAPYDGYCPLTTHDGPGGCGGVGDWAGHLMVPWLAFALPFTALYTRMTRSFVRETLDESWVQTARAKGAPESRVLRSHVLRASLVPLITMLGLDLGLVVGTVIYTEIVFDLPGLGALAYTSLNPGFSGFDLPTLVGVVVFTTVFVLVFNLIVDLVAPMVDPRIGRVAAG